jgi:hypothetical protein
MLPQRLVILFIVLVGINSLENGMGLTPPMGWNSWNHFACKIN